MWPWNLSQYSRFFCWSRMYSSIISLRIFLKVHQCRFENLPICLCSYIKKYPEKFAFLILKVLVRVSQNVKFVLKFTSRRIWLIFGQWIHWKASKSFLSWLCQYLLFSINRCFLNIFFNRLKVCGYPTLLISWFISFNVKSSAYYFHGKTKIFTVIAYLKNISNLIG